MSILDNLPDCVATKLCVHELLTAKPIIADLLTCSALSTLTYLGLGVGVAVLDGVIVLVGVLLGVTVFVGE